MAVAKRTEMAGQGMGMGGMSGGMGGMMGSRKGMMVADGAVATTVAVLQPSDAAVPPNASGISRKVVYDSTLELLVDSVEPASKRVPELVEDARGYISEQTMTGSPGAQRTERWKLRIPVERFDSFVEAVKPMGELAQFNRTSQDVTAEFYDVEARIKNKKVEEQTLNKILQERSGKLDDVLKIEIELSRVRGEIEQLQGRIRVLENLSSLATLTLNVRERDKFAPAAPVVADFPTQIARTWHASVLSLTDLGKSLVLFAVSWAIWTPFLALLAVLAWIVLRRIGPTLRKLPHTLATPRGE
ncbi:MAG: DUF4349 domain-containing protein [Paludisphaera borealis]|uniref:DUF4349 domain-containing protein n=1 Tax=Paludisphaera borealis TaxID=1387353 RepID=UPI00283C7C22|nr:DUF4349 domain-containing protein [Paludisphaera borealis]MDR3619682.1 DUF4349 domain-containing protein [Paludisphaera borealis]